MFVKPLLLYVQCNSSRSNSSCRGRRTVALGGGRGRWCTWNTPRGTPAPWRYSRCRHRPRCRHIVHSDLQVEMLHILVCLPLNARLQVFVASSQVISAMRSDCTKIVLRRGVVHVIHQLLGESLQLFLGPGRCYPLLYGGKKRDTWITRENGKRPELIPFMTS